MERFYRRNLPHWRNEGGPTIYLVTWRLASGQVNLGPSDRDLVASAVRYWEADRYELSAWVVMNDHVHVVVRPAAGRRLESLLHSWKSYSGGEMVRRYGRPGPVWQHESFDRILRSENEWREKVAYIAGNPWKRWPTLAHYPWVFPLSCP